MPMNPPAKQPNSIHAASDFEYPPRARYFFDDGSMLYSEENI
jgi:hypothetical protein